MGSSIRQRLHFHLEGQSLAFARRFGTAAIVMLAAALIGGEALTAANDADPLDRQLLDALEGAPAGETRLETPVEIIPRLLERTQAAAARLGQSQIDDATTALQAEILADIDALLRQGASAQPQQGESPESSSSKSPPDESSATSQSQTSSSEQGDASQDGPPDSNAAASESEERNSPGQDAAAERESKLGLSTSAWGHLPPKVREQIRSAFSEEYLPEYDALVRRYYEALARRRSADRAEAPRSDSRGSE